MQTGSQRAHGLHAAITITVFAVIVAAFAVRNLPWHLDNYDQAKQAFTSHEMVNEGHWLAQHTPSGRVATKPPLAGWVSAGLHLAGVPWALAWRLPGFLCALAVIGALWRCERAMFGGGVLAVAAFGLNLITPRIATLVRTDMMLAALIFFIGAVSLRNAGGEPWTTRDRWLVFALVLAALLVKGPIVYAFLGPGWAAYAWFSRRVPGARNAWPGWWCVLAPLAAFAGWVWLGVATMPGFYEQVIEREFLGRFTVGEEAVHHNHAPGYYTAVLVARFLPWSGALLGLVFVRAVRSAFRADARLLWLACWALGGLFCMELVPSKRFDRIFPALAPLCLLLPAMAKHAVWDRRRLARWCIVPALVVTCAHTGWEVYHDYTRGHGGLVAFGENVARTTAGQRLLVVSGKDEGLLIYTGQTRFTRPADAERAWVAGKVDWLVLPSGEFKKRRDTLPCAEVRAEVGQLDGKNSAYILLGRSKPSVQ